MAILPVKGDIFLLFQAKKLFKTIREEETGKITFTKKERHKIEMQLRRG
jgi:hypothetical protein